MKDLRAKIIRRTYYIYALRQLSHPVVSHGVVLVSSFFVLSQTVSIPNIWANMLEVKVGELADFFIGSLLNTQQLVLLILGVMAVTAFSLTWRLFSARKISRISLSPHSPELA